MNCNSLVAAWELRTKCNSFGRSKMDAKNAAGVTCAEVQDFRRVVDEKHKEEMAQEKEEVCVGGGGEIWREN